jgi:hypothetical protein
MDWVDKFSQFWPHLAVGFHLLAALLASAHALLNKRDTRAATLWIAFIWLLPALGPLLYLVLGVNRIRRRALILGVHKRARLNFEINVECYGRELARDLTAVIEEKLIDAREVTLAEVDARTIPGKLRDAAARLFSPYL